jgi:hypothetical protein
VIPVTPFPPPPLAHKKCWLVPAFLVMLLVGGLAVFTKGSVIAPLIYTMF